MTENTIQDSDAFQAAWDEPQKSALSQGELDKLTEDLIEALKTVYDPEIPVDIYELGLIYRVDVNDDRDVVVDMTLTAPGCPVAGEMPGWVAAIYAVDNEIHHRAQGYVYLRALGIEPPAFYER